MMDVKYVEAGLRSSFWYGWFACVGIMIAVNNSTGTGELSWVVGAVITAGAVLLQHTKEARLHRMGVAFIKIMLKEVNDE